MEPKLAARGYWHLSRQESSQKTRDTLCEGRQVWFLLQQKNTLFLLSSWINPQVEMADTTKLETKRNHGHGMRWIHNHVRICVYTRTYACIECVCVSLYTCAYDGAERPGKEAGQTGQIRREHKLYQSPRQERNDNSLYDGFFLFGVRVIVTHLTCRLHARLKSLRFALIDHGISSHKKISKINSIEKEWYLRWSLLGRIATVRRLLDLLSAGSRVASTNQTR